MPNDSDDDDDDDDNNNDDDGLNVEDDDDCSQSQILVEQLDSRTSGAQGGLTIAISYPIDSKDRYIHMYIHMFMYSYICIHFIYI